MLPDNAQILVCPHCGQKKEIMSLLSGNTFGQTIWSDNKQDAPMLPQVSFIQKCPHCGKYYLTWKNMANEQGEEFSFELGTLNYVEAKEAWAQLKEENLDNNEKSSALMTLIWAFNDEFSRDGEKAIPEEEMTYITGIVDELIATGTIDQLMQAELLRETMRMDEAKAILNELNPKEDYMKEIKAKIENAIDERDSRVIIIYGGR